MVALIMKGDHLKRMEMYKRVRFVYKRVNYFWCIMDFPLIYAKMII